MVTMKDKSLKDVLARFASETTAHAPPKVCCYFSIVTRSRRESTLAFISDMSSYIITQIYHCFYLRFVFLNLPVWSLSLHSLVFQVVTRKYVIAKMFWLLMFFTGIGVCVYFCQSLISSFLEYNTTTDIEVCRDTEMWVLIAIFHHWLSDVLYLPSVLSQVLSQLITCHTVLCDRSVSVPAYAE